MEEGRSISLVDSIRATHVDSGSDRERVHTTQFDVTVGDTGFDWPRGSYRTSRSRDWRHGCFRQLMLCLKLSKQIPVVSDPDPVVGEVREGRRSEVWTQSTLVAFIHVAPQCGPLPFSFKAVLAVRRFVLR